jgi:cytochrome P450
MGRVVPKGGAYLAGRKFDEGVHISCNFANGQTVVGINSWVAHRNPNVFGADVDKFIPERWLVDDEHCKSMDRYFMAVYLLETLAE